jgi:hypothetical protein
MKIRSHPAEPLGELGVKDHRQQIGAAPRPRDRPMIMTTVTAMSIVGDKPAIEPIPVAARRSR